MKNVSFPNGHMLVNGIELTHFGSDDDVVKFERLADGVNYKVGADGKMIVSHSADRSGKCTIKLQATSPSNSYLMGLVNLQGGGPTVFVPVQLSWQDIYRKDVASAVPGCIVKIPDFMRGMDNTGNDMEWQFVVERYDLLLGNPAFLGMATAAAEAAGG
jgi:Protein of unknown function (DUF3277)